MPPLDSPYRNVRCVSVRKRRDDGSDTQEIRQVGATHLIATRSALTPAVHRSDHHESCIGQPVERNEQLPRGALAYVAAAVIDDDGALTARSLGSVDESHDREVLTPVGQLEELESSVGTGSLVHCPVGIGATRLRLGG
jgi:hypothetical protein